MGGAPKFEESQSLPDVSYADVARTMGSAAIAVDTEAVVAGAWEQALSCRSADAARHPLRPRGAADPAACDLRPDQGNDGRGT